MQATASEADFDLSDLKLLSTSWLITANGAKCIPCLLGALMWAPKIELLIAAISAV